LCSETESFIFWAIINCFISSLSELVDEPKGQVSGVQKLAI
jgi:hypothetical protein